MDKILSFQLELVISLEGKIHYKMDEQKATNCGDSL